VNAVNTPLSAVPNYWKLGMGQYSVTIKLLIAVTIDGYEGSIPSLVTKIVQYHGLQSN